MPRVALGPLFIVDQRTTERRPWRPGLGLAVGTHVVWTGYHHRVVQGTRASHVSKTYIDMIAPAI